MELIYKKRRISNLKLLEDFLNNEQSRNKSPQTIASYRLDLLKFLGWLQDTQRNIKKIGPQDISAYTRHLSGLPTQRSSGMWEKWVNFARRSPEPALPLKTYPLKSASKRRHLTAVRMFFRFLMESDAPEVKRLRKNPVVTSLHSVKLKDIDVNHTKLLLGPQFQRLLQANKDIKSQFILHLLYFGGLRLAELCVLSREDFNFQNKTVKLIRKGGSIHYLPLQNFDFIYELLERYCYTYYVERGSLFFDPKRRHSEERPSLSQRSMYGVIKRRLKKALSAQETEELGPHSFRKACATELYKKTKDLLFVRNYLNHQDAKVTQTYIEYT